MTYTIYADSYTGSDDAKLAAAFAAVRTLVNTSNVGARLVIAPRLWQVSASIDARSIAHDASWVIDAEGAVLLGTCTGKAVLDFVGSRSFVMNGGLISGDGTSKPSIGILYGRDDSLTQADCMTFNAVKLDGHFTTAALYNLGAETDTHLHPSYYNKETGARVVIIDGAACFGANSDHTLPSANTAFSCIQHTFVGADIRGPANATAEAVAITHANQIRFVNSYIACANAFAVGIYSFDASGTNDDEILDAVFDLHMETNALGAAFKFIKGYGSLTDLVIRGFTHREMGNQATDELYLIDSALTSVTIHDADIHVETGLSTLANGVCYPSGKLKIIGNINTTDLNLANLAHFSGVAKTNDYTSSSTYFCAGSYTVFDKVNAPLYKGLVLSKGADVFTGNFTALNATPQVVMEGGSITAKYIVGVDGGEIQTAWTSTTISPASQTAGSTFSVHHSYFRIEGKKAVAALDFECSQKNSGSGLVQIPLPTGYTGEVVGAGQANWRDPITNRQYFAFVEGSTLWISLPTVTVSAFGSATPIAMDGDPIVTGARYCGVIEWKLA